MRFALCIAAIALAATSHAADSDDWIRFATSQSGSTHFIRSGSIEKAPNGNWLVWARTDLTVPEPVRDGEPNGPTYTQSMTRFVISCANKALSPSSVHKYDERGRVVSSHEWGYRTPSPAVPESIGESLVTVVCAAMETPR